jgi:hypothetical protein
MLAHILFTNHCQSTDFQTVEVTRPENVYILSGLWINLLCLQAVISFFRVILCTVTTPCPLYVLMLAFLWVEMSLMLPSPKYSILSTAWEISVSEMVHS